MINSIMGENCNKVLVRGVNWIGDAVMTMPALRALRAAMPDAHISLLVKPWVSGLFEKDPSLNEIILYSHEHEGVRGKFKLSRKLLAQGFCLAVLFQNAFDAAAVAFLSGIKKRVGYARDGRSFLLTNAVPFDEKARKLHHIDYYLNLISKSEIAPKAADAPESDRLPWIYLGLEERLWARQTLKKMKRPILGINPGAAYGLSKRWGGKKFAEVGVDFIAEFGGSVVVFGSDREEAEVAGLVAGACQCNPEGRVLSLAGKTSLRELIALISECDIILSNDSGPMHIAYATRRPLVAVFGSTSPELTGPPALGSQIIRHPLPCSPCFKRTCKENTLACMNSIRPEEVYAAVRKSLPQKKAVFFDRDGTLIKDANYLRRWEDFEPLQGLKEIPRLKEKGFTIIGVTNQSGIARGIVDEGFVNDVNNHLIQHYGIDDFLYCPHHPDEHCPCRKPEPELAMRAALKHGIDLKSSFVVGDKEADMLLAKAIGAKAIMVLTGQGSPAGNEDFVAKDLTQAIDWIIQVSQG